MENEEIAKLRHDLNVSTAQSMATAHAMHALLISLRHGLPGICDAMAEALEATSKAWLQAVALDPPAQAAYEEGIANFRSSAGASKRPAA